MENRNQAMLLTPAGAAAIAVVRIVGTGTQTFLKQHFSRPTTRLRCVHGELSDEAGEVIDDPVIVLHEQGHTADINLHGGPWVVAATLDLLRRNGFDISESLAPNDGKATLEREMFEALPRAVTEQGIRMLLAQPEAWRAFVDRGPTADHVRAVLDDRCLERLLHPPRVAIVGPPNVGKSTLANQLFAQERSITADIPGTTRDWVGEIANIDGLPVMLLDTPGVRETPDPIEHRAIEASRQVVQGADLIVYVIDASAPFVPATRNAVLRLLNKVDMGTPPGLEHDIATVATTGQGVEQLRAEIRKRLGCENLDPSLPRTWTERQREVLRASLEHNGSLEHLGLK